MNEGGHMNGMDGGHMNGMDGGMGVAPPPGVFNHRHMMHMTFFWGENTEILFSGWPGYNNSGMYALALVVVFLLAVIVEWLSHCNYTREGSNRLVAGLLQTLIYAIRVGLAYMVMLAVMSFNAGVFLVAIAGHTVGFFIFGSRVFKKTLPQQGFVKASDLSPSSC
ncbi:copper transporter 6-like [Olea europaea var. sylvestris]|uniref:Copper transport protein n=1 Tax=Olea europaea subsp. europaea TaxID=158383 RepID=A0A8S0QVB8_OLEEU|nr:copper transporter 6-like [Olea europaea var. sylvestris]CAA2969649.1 copper transporter 1-like [Olea europaea subsp. europaea]